MKHTLVQYKMVNRLTTVMGSRFLLLYIEDKRLGSVRVILKQKCVNFISRQTHIHALINISTEKKVLEVALH